MTQTVKNLPAMQGTWAQSLGWEDLLEEGMTAHSNIPAWRIPWTEECDKLQSMGMRRIERASLVAQPIKNHLQFRRPRSNSHVRKFPWRRDRLPTPVFLGSPGGLDGKESTFSVGVLGSNPGLERSPGGKHGNPLQYSGLENLHRQRSLAGYSPWRHKELDMTRQLRTHSE